MSKFILTLAFVACLLLCSCGSFFAVRARFEEDANPPYIATRTQTMFAWATLTQADMGYHWPAPPLWTLPLFLFDLPFTALTETLLLPVDVIQMIGSGGRR